MADQKLVNYVRSSLERGMPLARIRLDLHKAGWPKKDIEEAIVSAREKPQTQTAPVTSGKREEKSRRSLYIAIIVLILAGIGAATYLTVLAIFPPPPIQTVCGDGTCSGQETYETCPADCYAPMSNAGVRVSPQYRAVGAGENPDFKVEISSVSNLYGFQFDLEYDPATLNFTKSLQGDFLSRDGAENVFCMDAKAKPAGTANYVTIACTRLGAVGGVSGSGTLASITFSALKAGTIEMKLANVKLVDSNNKRIDSSL